MKKTIMSLILIIILFNSCGKVYNSPLENYYLSTNKSKIYRFNESTFGLQLWRGYSWVKCEKFTTSFTEGYIYFDNKEFRYSTNIDTVKLYEHYSDVYPDTLKYTLIYDRSQVNFPGIFKN